MSDTLHDPVLPLARPRRLMVASRHLVLAQIGVRLLSLVALLFLANALGAATYGLYYTAVVLAGNWSVLAQGGLRVALMDDLARRPQAGREILGQVTALRLVGAGAALALGAFQGWLDFFDAWQLTVFGALLLAGVVNALALTYEEALFSQRRLSRLVWLPTLSASAVNGAIIVGCLLGRPLLWTIAAQALAALLDWLVLAHATGRRLALPPLAWRWHLLSARLLARRAFGPLVLALLAVWYGRADLLVARGLLGDVAIGVYCLDLRLLDMVLAVVTTIAVALQPVFSEASLQPGAQYRAAATALRAGALALVPLCILVGDLGSVVLWPFAPEYHVGAEALGILVWVALWAYYNAILHHLLLRAGRGWEVAASLVCGLLVALAVGYYAVPRWGIGGAAAARLAGEMTVCAAAVMALRQVTWMGWTTIVLKPAGMGLAMAAVWMLWPKGPWFYRSPASLLVYVVLALLIEPLHRDEWRAIAATLRRRVVVS